MLSLLFSSEHIISYQYSPSILVQNTNLDVHPWMKHLCLETKTSSIFPFPLKNLEETLYRQHNMNLLISKLVYISQKIMNLLEKVSKYYVRKEVNEETRVLQSCFDHTQLIVYSRNFVTHLFNL